MIRRLASLALVVLAAYTTPPSRWTDSGPVAAKLSCNPLAKEWDCFYPWPSDFYLAPDATRPNGSRVEVPDAALPTFLAPGGGTAPISFFDKHPTDGFSVLPQIAVRIPGGLDVGGLVSVWKNVGDSLKASSETLLVDADTGALQLHFAEIDPRPDGVDDRALVMRPLKRLANGHRYIVALHGLKHADGTAIKAPKMFADLRDGKPSGDYETRMQAYYDARIFPALEKAGVKRADLQLAWDFTTESEAGTTGDMLSVRAQALALYAKAPPEVTVTKVLDGDATGDAHIGREVDGTMKVPLFLDAAEPGSLLHRDAKGLPAQHGFLDVPFHARIPASVLSGAKAGRLVQYGHGFFGDQTEADGPYPSAFADETGSVLVATDWKGMSVQDRIWMGGTLLENPPDAMDFVDSVHQGMVDFISLARVATDVLPGLPSMQDSSGQPLYDASHVYYYGISQGAILGATYLALSPQIDRAALSVGGCSWGLLMSRANPFDAFLHLIDDVTHDKAATMKVELLMQTPLDALDPATWAPHLLAHTLPGAPASRKILFQAGLGDPEVPVISEQVFMRSLAVPLLAPAPADVFGLKDVAAPVDGSALAEWDFGLPEPDLTAIPAQVDDSFNPHELVRRQPAAIQMIDRFLTPDGKIENTCGGVCRGVDVQDEP